MQKNLSYGGNKSFFDKERERLGISPPSNFFEQERKRIRNGQKTNFEVQLAETDRFSSRYGPGSVVNNVELPTQTRKSENKNDLSNLQHFVRGAGNVIDGLVPFGDPVKKGLVRDIDSPWLRDTFRPAESTGQKAVDIINDIGGSIPMFGGAYKGASKVLDATKGINSLTKAKPKLDYLEEAQKGSMVGAAYGVQDEVGKAISGDSQGWKPAVRNIALETGLGAALDPAIVGIGSLIFRGLQRGANKQTIQKAVDQFRNNETGEEVKQLFLPPPQTQTRITAKRSSENYAQKLQDLFNQANDLPPGREVEALDDLWNRIKAYEDPSLDELIMQGTPTLQQVQMKSNPLDTMQRARQTQQRMNQQSVYGVPERFQRTQEYVPPTINEGIRPTTKIQAIAPEPTPSQPLTMLDRLRNRWNNSSLQDPLVMKWGRESNKATNDPSRLRAQEKKVRVGDDYNSFRNKIDRNPKNKNKFSSVYQKLRTQFVEDLAPIETFEKNIRGNIPEAQESLYKQARLFRGSPEKAHNFVRTRIQPIVKQVEDAGYSYEDLGDYALAVHSRDVNSRGIQSGFTDNEIQSVIQRLGSPEMEAARKQLVNVSTDLLNTLENSQVLEPGTAQALRERWPNYMPLFRSFDDDKIEFGAGLSRTLANAQNPIKKLEGSDRDVVDPIESMVKNTFKTFNVADRNTVGLQLSQLAKEDNGQFIKRVTGDTKRKNVVSVMEEGKKVKYEVPAEVYETITNLNQEASNMLVKMLQKPASVLRAGATLDPVFSIRNPMRDIVQAYVVSNSGFNPIRDFPAGLFNAIFKGKKVNIGGKEVQLGKYYQDFIEANGGFGNIVSMDRNLHRKALQQGFNQKSNVFVNVLHPKQWMEVLRSIADASETATKVGEFRAAIRKGVSNEEAAYRARDIMDFSRSGTAIREANKVVAFLNANIQGKSKLIRAITQNPGKVTAKALASVTAPTIGFYAASHLLANEKQKQAIDDAPQWLKETFWLTPIPGTDMVARIPKPFDLVIFSNPVERALDYVAKNDKQAFDGFLRELAAGQSLPVMMTGLAPFVEGMANYSFFRQGPIIPQREQDLNFPDQYDVNTTGTARFIAEQVNKVTGGEGSLKNFGSPRVVDNTIRGITAGLGTYVTNAIDSIFFDDYYNRPEKPAKDFLTERTPLRGFLVNEMGTGQSMNELYDLRDELRRAKGSAQQRQEPFKEGGKLKFIENATGRIGDISSRMRQIENDPNLSGEEKRNQLEELNEKRNELARQTWERVK